MKCLFLSILFILFSNYNVSCTERNISVNSDDDPAEPLILTKLIEEGKLEDAKKLAVVPDELFLGVKSYSGYLTVDKEHNSNSFFWFIPATNTDYKDVPLLLWLQGGPGGPSIFSIFVENGPFITNKEKVINLRNISWTSNQSVLYIDNPVGTGYSFTNGGWRKNEEEIATDLYNALIQFFKLFPELQKNDFYITGQSYGGKYVPAVSYKIHKENPKATLKINLKGLCIGNGLIDPINQLNYGDYLYETGLIDFNMQQEFNAIIKNITKLIEEEKFYDAYNILDSLFFGSKYPSLFKNATGTADYGDYVEPISLDLSFLDFLQQKHIRKAIHVGNKTSVTDKQVSSSLNADFVMSVAPWFTELMNHYRVLLYIGQLDVICNYPGTVNFLRKLNFNASEEYKTAPRHIWFEGDEVAGYVKEAGFLTEVMVRNAGHMVNTYKLDWATSMISKFVRNIPIY